MSQVHWMVSQISSIYFQSYQLAYDMALRAQRAYQYELADYDSSFVNFGYWDNLKKGLLAGEKLHYDLRRMETAYFEKNKREFELTKHISLLQLNPYALIQLRETGVCEIDVPEVLFDLDYAGHYLRRIKAVSLTIPCVTGPYTSVNATLTLLENRTRIRTNNPETPFDPQNQNEDRFIVEAGGTQSIATSSAREDSGMFEFNFRDERYLPFEGKGVVSRWRLELPTEFRQFDYDTIADVVLHMRYTARNGDDTFKTATQGKMNDAVNRLVAGKAIYHFVSMKQQFGSEFYQLLNSKNVNDPKTTITISKGVFPVIFQQKIIRITSVIAFLQLKDASLYDDTKGLELNMVRKRSPRDGESIKLKKASSHLENQDLPHALYSRLSGQLDGSDEWNITFTQASIDELPPALRDDIQMNGTTVKRLKADEVKDLGFIFAYELN